jgi:hypothetical protein
MEQDRALEVQHRAFGDFLALLAAASEGARLLQLDGITASVVPATPWRSMPNSVIYRDPSALEAAYDQLVGAYDGAGVNAWTVWAADFDPPAIELLSGRGHVFDGEPAAMVLDLAELGDPDLGDLDWDADSEIATLGAINDVAYGHEGAEGYARALVRRPEGLRLYQARADGPRAGRRRGGPRLRDLLRGDSP